jgi:hypothetical protein
MAKYYVCSMIVQKYKKLRRSNNSRVEIVNLFCWPRNAPTAPMAKMLARTVKA